MRSSITNKFLIAQSFAILFSIFLLGGTSFYLIGNALKQAQKEKLVVWFWPNSLPRGWYTSSRC